MALFLDSMRDEWIVNRRILLIVCWLATTLSAARCDEPAGNNAASAPPAAPSAEDQAVIRDLVAQLSSNQYVQREIASLELARWGAKAVPVLADQMGKGDLELTERAMQLLQRVAVQETPQDEAIGWNAITQLAHNGNGTTASRARAAMESISKDRQERARSQLTKAGISVGLSDVVLEATTINEEVVHISPNWDGDESALEWLGWLHGIHYVATEGSTINRTVIEKIAGMPDLQNVVIANTKLTADDLKPLLNMKRIDQLEIRYTPIEDAATEIFAKLPLRQKLVLSATKITPDAMQEMRAQLPGLQIIYKRGGFLGVNCDPWAAQCEVSRVVAGGAAEGAGIRAGDVITAIGDKPIGRFADLQEAIYGYAPGDAVAITLNRRGQVEQVTAKLGSLQSQPN